MATKAKKMVGKEEVEDLSELRRDAEVERIGQEILGLETLMTRNGDILDFSEQAVWTLRRALEAAYKAGQSAR